MIDALRAAGAMASAVLAFLLALAGTIKLADPRPATGSLRRVSPKLSRQPAGRLELGVRAIGAAELCAASASTALAGVVATIGSAAMVVLCTGFLWFTYLARQRGAACGCWGSLSDGPAGTGEVTKRVMLLSAAVVAFVASTFDQSRVLPVAAVVAVLAAGCVGGVLLASPGHRLTTVFDAAGIGVTIPQDAQRAVTRKVRRSTLAVVRHDLGVTALVAAMPQARIEWRQARVTSAQRRRQDMSNRLVAIPGAGGNLRIVAGPVGVLIAIGESPDAIYTVRDASVMVAGKVAAGSSAPAQVSVTTDARSV